MKKIKICFFVTICLLFYSCKEKNSNKENHDDFGLIQKYLKIKLNGNPKFVGRTTDCFELECNVISVYQLNIDQESYFLKYVKTDSLNHWHKNDDSDYFRLEPVKITDSKFLEVEYTKRSNILIINRLEI